MPVQHDIAAERDLWDAYASSPRNDVTGAEPVFNWTQYQGHGPGTEILGNPVSVLEIGCGTGRALAHLAQRGVRAKGVDLSPIMVANITKRWESLGVEFACAEVLEFLADGPAVEILADAGYQGLGAQTGGRVVTPPHRKFKKKAPDWYEERYQRQRTAHSSRRIRVEHGIAHLKNWRALARHLGHREHISDTVQAVAGLLSHQQTADLTPARQR
ncbi:methyltransferase domain-containing protein [Streptomyces pini]|uniref:DDE superfamily endonuclease n=1 Tax=Streptomyces pini TaxID=1520580 RepID=A0A1I4J1D8_9ACTN|nr:methyltransferase domain-containing protein [Streptomyces pini]SFL60395.1 DDE superfamily endonuclease [Streptomyces pini]